ncbi:MAG TPA: aldehyde dehydrogenase (NADP(+)) [Pirellulales bacterium]|jgi:NADP-dependent aldehyde dehydrogenase
MAVEPVLIGGKWQASANSGTFQAENPADCKFLPEVYPVSSWSDIDAALTAAAAIRRELRESPGERIAIFLEAYASLVEERDNALVDMAHAETALPKKPRLAEVELPRTTGQLRAAAATARSGDWQEPIIDTKLGIRSCYSSLGPVWVFGPNNFPFAFNSIAGGDFAAAIAAGNPIIAKANTSHPGTSRLLAQAAHEAVLAAGLPNATVQLLYRTSHEDGARAVADPRTAATAYTGSRFAGLVLKAAADRAGKPIYLELSSINPVVVLPGAIRARGEPLAAEFTTSCLMGTGQFCTNPGLVILISNPETNQFLEHVRKGFDAAATGTLLSGGVAKSLQASVTKLQAAGASVLSGGKPGGGKGHSFANTLLSVTATQFLKHLHELQTEAFGNVSLVVLAETIAQAGAVIDALEGNLTGCIYSDISGSDDAAYDELAPRLRTKVGRLLNDKMPTGVAVSPAMNHGGPYPATGHPGFTAVGIPAAIRRFTALECYDNVRPQRLPAVLRDKSPNGAIWRMIDGRWSQDHVNVERQ